MNKPSEYRTQGYNCAESIIKAYNEEFNENIPVRLGSGLGVGACSGSICGAVNASVIIIGYLKGRDDSAIPNEANNYVRKMMTCVKEKYSTDLCRELKANKISCAEIIDFSYEALKEVLNS